MPEEQAFMLLCKLMEDQRYLLREMYKANFENLQVRFHQLNCLIQDNLSDIYAHFDDLKVECHMFASQWFLTLFTAKFPLYLVFRIMDLFLYEVCRCRKTCLDRKFELLFFSLGFQLGFRRCSGFIKSKRARFKEEQ